MSVHVLVANMNGYSYNNGEVEIMKNVNLSTISKIEKLLVTASDKTRLKIMLALLDDSLCHCGHCEEEHDCSNCKSLSCMIEKCVNDIASEIGASQSLVSHQLKVLKDADLVRTRKESTKVYYSLKDKHIRLLIGVAYDHVMEGESND